MLAAMDPALAVVLLPGLAIGITVHEFAHAWSASLLGDDFPRRQGRVSLNPLRHLSLLGTLVLFVLPIGWGRPVMINLHNFRRPKLDYLLSSLAGPLANLVLAGLLMLVMLLTRHTFRFGNPLADVLMSTAHTMLSLVVVINIMLAALNLIPIPPLDGSKIWPCLIPGARPGVGKKLTWVFLALLLALVWTGSLGVVIGPAMDMAWAIMPKSDADRVESLVGQADEALLAEDYDLAERLTGEQLAIHESHEAYYTRACARGWRGNWQGALEDMNRAIALRPMWPAYYEFRADTLDALGRVKDAADDRKKARLLGDITDGLVEQDDADPTD